MKIKMICPRCKGDNCMELSFHTPSEKWQLQCDKCRKLYADISNKEAEELRELNKK